MRLRKVMNLRTSLGGLHGKTSYDAIKDDAEMLADIEGAGVEITRLKGVDLNPTTFIGWQNIVEAHLVPEAKVLEAPKRGPGRPPVLRIV